jgi:hypothetical protein
MRASGALLTSLDARLRGRDDFAEGSRKQEFLP